jgi:Site-specific recombinase XerD
MKTSDLQNDETILDWFATINPKHNTKLVYLQALQEYTNFTNKTPEELLKEAEAEVRNGVLMRERSIRRRLTRFREHLEKQEIAPLTVKARMAGVYSFYRHNYIEIPILPKSTRKAKPLQCHRDIPTKDELREVLNVCEPIEKAILLVGASSGLSVNEIVNLKIKDFKKGYDPITNITTLSLRREKVDYDFITFLTPEATNAVLDYMAFRNRKPKSDDNKKRREQLLKQEITTDAGYMFISRAIPNEYLKTKDEKLRKLDEKAVMTIYRQLSEKSQKNAERGIWNTIRSHNLRKYFNSTLLNAGADIFFVDYLMGHTLDSTHDAYFRADPKGLKEKYKKFIPFLTIQKELDLSESPEYQAIKSENDILRAETAKHVVERQEIINLKNEVAKGNVDRAELNALKHEIESIYREMKKTKDGFNATAPLIHKIHPHRLLFPPGIDDHDVDPDQDCM